MSKKPGFSWPLIPQNNDESSRLLTDAEMTEMHKVFDPLIDVLDAYVEANGETWTFDAMHEALARAHDYLLDMEREIDAGIAAEEADA
jgi:hypothetical protein